MSHKTNYSIRLVNDAKYARSITCNIWKQSWVWTVKFTDHKDSQESRDTTSACELKISLRIASNADGGFIVPTRHIYQNHASDPPIFLRGIVPSCWSIRLWMSIELYKGIERGPMSCDSHGFGPQVGTTCSLSTTPSSSAFEPWLYTTAATCDLRTTPSNSVLEPRLLSSNNTENFHIRTSSLYYCCYLLSLKNTEHFRIRTPSLYCCCYLPSPNNTQQFCIRTLSLYYCNCVLSLNNAEAFPYSNPESLLLTVYKHISQCAHDA